MEEILWRVLTPFASAYLGAYLGIRLAFRSERQRAVRGAIADVLERRVK
jgi:hypothetical protein